MEDLVYGVNPVREALRGRRRPLELFAADDRGSPRLQAVVQEAEAAGVPVRRRARHDLDRLAGHRQHQGLVLRLAPFAYASLDDLLSAWRASARPAFFLVVDGVTDPRNLGALLRSAEAAGCHGVILPKDRSCPMSALVDKASAGAAEHLPVCRVTNLARTIDLLKDEGVWVFGLAGDDAAESLYGADLRDDLALVVGSEGGGLRPNIRRHCDLLLAIPLPGAVDSLNVSVAAGVALFETLRQRRG